MRPLRSLAQSPGFTAVAVLTVALGIASTTAIFSVANGVLFRPLPFREESSLAWIWSTRPDRDRAFFSVPDFLDLRRANTTTADLAAITPLGFNLTGSGEPERVLGWRVSPNLFSVLGVEPHIGRLPGAADDRADTPPVAVLGFAYWQRHFGGNAAVVGKAIMLNGTPHVVAAVLARDFLIPNWETDIVVAHSLEADPRRGDRGTNFLRAIARLKPGVTFAEAQGEFAALSQRLSAAHPDTNAAITAPRFVPLRDEVIGGYRGSLLMLLAAAAALLLIMSANLAGLLAARALTRQRDAALCSALGASPARLLRMYLSEGLLIALAGGVLGVLASAWGLDALLALAPADLPRASQIAIDGRVLAVALGCTLLTGLGVGLAPALRLARIAPQDVLKSGSAGATSRTTARGVLAAAQIALCAVLLVGSGLLVRSLHQLLQTPPGFVSAGVLTGQVSLANRSYPTPASVVRFVDDYAAALRALPGVKSVGVTSVLPLTGINTRSEFTRADRAAAKPADTLSAANRFISESYFATAGIPLVAGRDFQLTDDPAHRAVVIIDQALARRHWPGEDPLGKVVRIRDGTSPQPRELEIVGVAGTTKNFSLEEAGTPTLYLPLRQLLPGNLPFFVGRITFVAKAAADPLAPALSRVEGLKESARRALRGIDPNAAISLRTFDEAVAWAKAPRVFNVTLLGFFSVAAVLLALLGLYAITAQSVTARTREIGIRMALGADRVRIARETLGRGAGVIAAGIGGGLALAAITTPLIARMLYQVRPFDPPTYVAVAAALLLVTFAATWLPTRRAMRVNPISALRAE